MMGVYYILDENKQPVEEPNEMKWGAFMSKVNRRVAFTKLTSSVQGKNVGHVEISTVFLGLDHQFGDGPPLLFETMVFGGPLDETQERCSTWAEAEIMHEQMIKRHVEHSWRM